VQGLQDVDPDVDAVFRLVHNHLPVYFASTAGDGRPASAASDGAGRVARAVPEGSMAPFNAQSTLWARSGFWAMLLPVTVHGRVSDIWRSYVAQRLMWGAGLRLAFAAPWVNQFRNVHNYLADYEAEKPLYSRAGALTQYLREWRPPSGVNTLPACLEELAISLYEVGVLEQSDVHLYQAWLQDLHRHAQYLFPPVHATHEATGEPTGVATTNVGVTTARYTNGSPHSGEQVAQPPSDSEGKHAATPATPELRAQQQRERLARAKGAGQEAPHVRPMLPHRQVGENDTRWRTVHGQHTGADGFAPSRKFAHGHPESQ